MQIHKNTFEGGLNTNISKALIPANKYVEANNVNIAGTSNFFALENIRGSNNLLTILPYAAGVGIGGVFASKYKIGNNSNVECLTIFSYTNTLYTIWCYDTGGQLFKLYEETITSSYSSGRPIINAISYPEAGFDILYFTDNVNEPRKLKCEITLAQSATPTVSFLAKSDLKLLQRGANGKIEVTTVGINGSLFSGSYQFAYQLVNPLKNIYTKWSLLTNPAQVYINNGLTTVKSGVGLQSNASISLRITPSDDELGVTVIADADKETYTHFRLAVIENIEPSGVLVQKAWLSKLETINSFRATSGLNYNAFIDYTYATNTRIESIPVTDIVVDKMAIGTLRTINTRDNRLVGGDITYKDLTLNNGTPTVGAGFIIKQAGSGVFDNLFCDSFYSSNYRGYFRDEVYRFAISYFDEDGNFSYPQVLDLTNITHNQITGAYKDMKFPARSQNIGGTTYTLFSATDGIQSLGLRLQNITNHPKWAKGFIILRAERIKDVIFQTPIIPLNHTESVGAVEKYPYTALELSGAVTKVVSYPDAQPMGPFTTHMPRNYFYLNNRKIKTRTAAIAGAGTVNATFTGEAYFEPNNAFKATMVFPPSFMYESVPFTFNPNYKLKTIDAALTKGYFWGFSDFGAGTTLSGKNIRTSVAGTYYAVQDTQYYYNATHTGAKAVIGGSRSLNFFEKFDNLSSPSSVGGFNLFNHDKFETPDITFGSKGSVQKCGVFILDTEINEINNDSLLVFAAGSQISHVPVDTAFYLASGTLVHTIEIANVVAGLSDTRYGAYNTPHNFISTGTIYTFSTTELVNVVAGTATVAAVDVWGGDCYVAPHTFKITDTTYSVTNNGKYDGSGGEATSVASVQNWTRAFNDDTANQCAVSLPVPIKNAASFIEIVMESEYNTSIPDAELLNIVATDGTETVRIPIYGLNTTSEGSCRVPLTYRLNHNHRKQNSDKVFQIKDPLLADVTNLGARLVYSDQKVYQTSITGFDTFRVLNFKDLPESHGKIRRLEVLNDYMYAIQDKAVSYIGIGERVLETSDALTLSVQSGQFIGNIITISTNAGTQHTSSVVNTGSGIYFVDNNRQSINRIIGKEVQNISESDIFSSLRTALSVERGNNELLSIYDPLHKQVWFSQNGAEYANPFCYIFDEARNIWVANYQFVQDSLYGAAYTRKRLYLVGKTLSNNVAIEDMYNGNNRTILLGTTVTPSVKVVVNPQMEIGKVFDDILVPANDRLSTVDFSVTREASLGDQNINGIVLDVTTRGEGNYRAKVLRDAANARLRGLYATANLKWKTGAGQVAVAIPSVLTKYKVSDNRF